jgi:biopolymer transport protein ExbD
MNFRQGRKPEEPEINLIPMIDVLLVILIFLMITTTYTKFSGLEINLPTAEAPADPKESSEVNVLISASGDLMVNTVPVGGRDVQTISLALKKAAGTMKDPVVIINSDRDAKLQSSIDVMQAAQQAGLSAITFATQTQPK